jgi:hypothetical protein
VVSGTAPSGFPVGPGSTPGQLRVDFPGRLRVVSVSVPGGFRVDSGLIPGRLRVVSGSAQG